MSLSQTVKEGLYHNEEDASIKIGLMGEILAFYSIYHAKIGFSQGKWVENSFSGSSGNGNVKCRINGSENTENPAMEVQRIRQRKYIIAESFSGIGCYTWSIQYLKEAPRNGGFSDVFKDSTEKAARI